MNQKRVAWMAIVTVAMGLLAGPAAAEDIEEFGTLWGAWHSYDQYTCTDDGNGDGVRPPSYASKSYPDSWTYFEFIGHDSYDSIYEASGEEADMYLCGRMGWVDTIYGPQCQVWDAKGSVVFPRTSGRQTLWLRGMQSLGYGEWDGQSDYARGYLTLVGEVVTAPDAATAATQNAHHYANLNLGMGIVSWAPSCQGDYHQDVTHGTLTVGPIDQRSLRLPSL